MRASNLILVALNVVIPLLVVAVGCSPRHSATFSLGGDVSVKSPNGKLLASTGVVPETLLLVKVTNDASGELLASVNTKVSRIHRWSLTWYDDETILIRSSDIGPITIKLQSDGTWKTGSTLETTSPDQRFVARSYSSANHLRVSLAYLDAVDGEASRVALQFDPQLEITDPQQLEFCLTWVGSTRLEAKIGDQSIGWSEQPDGSWTADDKTKYELIQ